MISEELLSEVLKKEVSSVSIIGNTINYVIEGNESQEDDELVYIDLGMNINIYELAHLNLKQWANFKNVFNIIDWSGEPEEIIAKAEEIMNEIN